jgi:hypothetical protein
MLRPSTDATMVLEWPPRRSERLLSSQAADIPEIPVPTTATLRTPLRGMPIRVEPGCRGQLPEPEADDTWGKRRISQFGSVPGDRNAGDPTTGESRYRGYGCIRPTRFSGFRAGRSLSAARAKSEVAAEEVSADAVR